MRKIFFLPSIALLFQVCILRAQTIAINETGAPADPSAMLDVSSISKGFLAPRMDQAQRTAIASPATGLIVYQTNGTPGMYINQGTPVLPNWVLLVSSTSNNFWSLYGNAGTSAANFIGTIDNEPLIFKANNNFAAKISDGGTLSTSFGYQAGAGITGTSNTALGYKALRDNTTGQKILPPALLPC